MLLLFNPSLGDSSNLPGKYPTLALSALSASHKFLCCGLSTLASDYLARRLSLSNVLMVLQVITLHCPREQGNIPVCASPKHVYNNLNDNPESVISVEKYILGKKFKC